MNKMENRLSGTIFADCLKIIIFLTSKSSEFFVNYLFDTCQLLSVDSLSASVVC